MKKTKLTEYTICDYHLAEDGSEVNAVGVTMPSGDDACQQHYDAYTEEIRLPDELGGDMSGFKISVDPGYKAKMVIKYKEKK